MTDTFLNVVQANMSAPRKKRAVEEEMETLEQKEGEEEKNNEFDDEDEMEDETDGSDAEMPNQEVQIEFEARNPEDHDFHGIRKLLQQLFLKANVNISELVDTIISQNYIGSVIRQADVSEEEDDDDDGIEDIFGVISVVNITERKNLDCIKQLKTMLLDRCKQCAPKEHDRFASILQDDSSHVGFLINERFLNIPPQIALPSFENLWKEVERAKKKKMKYEFGNYLMISKTLRLIGAGDGKGAKAIMDMDGMYSNAEEEFFSEEAVLKFEYSVAKERDTAVSGKWCEDEEELESMRTIMIIPADKMAQIMTKLQDVLAIPKT